jgi:hypothetical protein
LNKLVLLSNEIFTWISAYYWIIVSIIHYHEMKNVGYWLIDQTTLLSTEHLLTFISASYRWHCFKYTLCIRIQFIVGSFSIESYQKNFWCKLWLEITDFKVIILCLVRQFMFSSSSLFIISSSWLRHSFFRMFLFSRWS